MSYFRVAHNQQSSCSVSEKNFHLSGHI
uniref:Uncharacterized protein n=1 Tax=Rhizophora mucronata TaxID=61149 RepID=A0A2P2P6E0_RHIMU